ncbi:BCNT-domain-containing protein [Polychaeton citri CBS 116435]|uniref:SWR1-complex protein 5 n=1 Tax=Polychaeton citri CBS 116435 TaxID=1314669 RepID=A0A9P4QH14_9PEZI|nr:BCNT-domain-containing protein [Polychaeton citri CBS 116435]
MVPRPPRNEEPDIDDKNEYNEEADEDFNPTAAADSDEDASSSSEDEDTGKLARKDRPRKRRAEDLGQDLDSGDEATIQEQQARLKRGKKAKDEDARQEDEESAGEGGFVRTRAQRLVEYQRDRKRGAREGAVTVDVDALWAQLSAVPVGRPPPPREAITHNENRNTDSVERAGKENTALDGFITIKRQIEFAGEVEEVEERVPKSSKEAQAYLAEHPEADPEYEPASKGNVRVNDAGEELTRPLRRPSIFEPNPTAIVKGVDSSKLRLRAPSRVDVLMAERREETERRKKAEKMSTVGKSALDWKRYVAEEGLGEEMDKYQKGKGGYLEREDFLGRAQLAREVQGREARLKG